MGKKKWFSLMGLSIIFPNVLIACGVKTSSVQNPGEGYNWQDEARNKIKTPSTPKNLGNVTSDSNQVSASFPWPEREDQGYEKVWNWVRNLDKVIDLESPGLRNNPEAFKAALLAKHYEAKTLLGDVEYLRKNWESVKDLNNDSLAKRLIIYQDKLTKDESHLELIKYMYEPKRLFSNELNVKAKKFDETVDLSAFNLSVPIALLSGQRYIIIKYLDDWLDLQIAFLTLIDENDIEKSFKNNQTKFLSLLTDLNISSEYVLNPEFNLSIDSEKVFLQDLDLGNDINDRDIYKEVIKDENEVFFPLKSKILSFVNLGILSLENSLLKQLPNNTISLIPKYFYPKINPIKLKENWTKQEIEDSWKQFLNDGKNKFLFWPKAELK
ncbi:hypothetical protein ACW95P_04455 [Candidatus Mycoplasma pogonae]